LQNSLDNSYYEIDGTGSIFPQLGGSTCSLLGRVVPKSWPFLSQINVYVCIYFQWTKTATCDWLSWCGSFDWQKIL